MSHTQLSPPRLIQTKSELESVLAELDQPLLAVDTESNSLHAYHEQVCLIQFSTEHADYLIDPLVIGNLQPLAALFENPAIEKIYHAAEYDIMTLKRDFGFAQSNLFDTYVAARTLGWDQSGLASILESQFGVRQEKRYQRANWARRPLPEDMLNYARLDTHYLIPLRNQLRPALVEAGRLEEAVEAFDLLTHAPAHTNGFDPDGFWQLGDTRNLNGQQAAILRELYLFREKEAERRDVPSFRIVGNRALLALAKNPPAKLEELDQVKGFSGPRLDRYGSALMQAIVQGRQANPPQRPRPPRASDEVRKRYDRLRQWRKRTAQQRSVDSDLILPRDYLWEIARANPNSSGALRSLMEPLEWRFNTYGADILKLLRS
ncbi:MAG TPA: HRDC domain-containing protein [Anaerolineales bacterium]|jgi:ribonuclease D